jgi:hypothetical protein
MVEGLNELAGRLLILSKASTSLQEGFSCGRKLYRVCRKVSYVVESFNESAEKFLALLPHLTSAVRV